MVFGLTWLEIEPECTVSVADVLSTRHLIGLKFQINYVITGRPVRRVVARLYLEQNVWGSLNQTQCCQQLANGTTFLPKALRCFQVQWRGDGLRQLVTRFGVIQRDNERCIWRLGFKMFMNALVLRYSWKYVLKYLKSLTLKYFWKLWF